MSRLHRAIHGVASGYVLLAVTAVYSLASVPLALHYLSKERFALWALMAAIGGYLSLIDLGMSGSVARLLIDHKDEPGKGTYGSLIKTGWLVMLVQGVLVFLLGFVLAPLLSTLLKIETDLQTEFIQLLRWQAAALGVSFGLRIFGHLLQAHQRMDICNYGGLGSLVLNFALLWFFFYLGEGVFSLVWAALAASVGSSVALWWGCWQLKLFPARGAWGHVSWRHFHELFGYGKDLFLVAVGAQLITASQALIITRALGLQAAALWAVGTRTFTLVSQLIWRISDFASPAFCEMIVRGEQSLLRDRYRTMVILTASLSGFFAVSYALCNSPFVAVWTHGRFDWPSLNDLLLGIWLIVMALLHCHNGFVLVTKQIGFMRYVYFVEGLVYVAAALLVARHGGLAAIILCSVFCSTAFSGAYGTWRVSRYFGFSLREVTLDWLAPMARVLTLFVPVAVAAWCGCRGISQPLVRLVLLALLSGSLGFYFFLRYGLARGLQHELVQHAPKSFEPLLRRVFGGGAA
jgi:O-antigen/teichoic acid export membrane protein